RIAIEQQAGQGANSPDWKPSAASDAGGGLKSVTRAKARDYISHGDVVAGFSPRLFELARLYGIQTSYLDMTRQRRDADPEALLLVLREMGAGVEKFDDVPDALARRKDELRKRTVEPVMVAWDGKLGRRKFEFGYHPTEINGRETFVI